MPKIKNLIFDLDNTLYDFSSIWKKSNELTFKHFGYDKVVSYDEFFTMSKKVNRELVEKMNRGKRINLRNERLIRTFGRYDAPFSTEDCDRYYKKQFSYMVELMQPNKNVIQKFKELKEEYNLFVLTNGKAQEQRKKIKKLGLENIFKVYISEEIHISKPAPEAFLKVLEAEHLKKEETMMVGDSLIYDIFPAQNLGLRTCLIERKWHFDDRLHVYDGKKVKDIEQFLELELYL